tara:strand:- start:269 stop:457 length:189 start_codon:yes stop_codon:yes gene_type:complete
MKHTRAELKYIRNTLTALHAYKNADLPQGAKLWEPWMDGFLDRAENELRRTEHIKDDHQILT